MIGRKYNYFFFLTVCIGVPLGVKLFLFEKNTVEDFLSDIIRTGSCLVNLAGELELPISYDLSAFCGEHLDCFAEENILEVE